MAKTEIIRFEYDPDTNQMTEDISCSSQFLTHAGLDIVEKMIENIQTQYRESAICALVTQLCDDLSINPMTILAMLNKIIPEEYENEDQ